MAKRINLDAVLSSADFIYHKMREEEGRPQHGYGIESAQVKALAKALVKEINEILDDQ